LRSNRKSALIGASLAAIIILGAGGETAAQSSDEKQSSAEMSQEIKALRDRVEALQRRLDAQIEAEQQAKAAADAAAAQAAAAQAAAATIPAQVQRAVDAASPKTDKIYYKGATITLGGFLAAEYLYRSRDTTNDISTAFNKDYFNNNPVANTPQTVFTARRRRQTRSRATLTFPGCVTCTGRSIGTTRTCTCWRARPGRW
jgi:hypothetical protein